MFAVGTWLRPRPLISWMNRLLPGIWALTLLCTGWGLWEALWVSPPDYQQGELVRIMYVHVPASWMALFSYGLLAAASGGFVVWRIPVLERLAYAAAPIGLCFTFISLTTGAIWGKPTWGTWWAWDARLTSMLILFFLYLGYLSLRQGFVNPERGQRAASLLAVIGVINLPIIKWSVTWWHTLHQPASLMRLAKPAIDPAMLRPLLWMAGAFLGYFLGMLLWRWRTLLQEGVG